MKLYIFMFFLAVPRIQSDSNGGVVKAKSLVQLTCVTDDAASQVIWMLRGVPVSPVNSIEVTISDDTHTLIIQKFQTVKTEGGINHSGPWQCASNSLLSSSVRLTKASKCDSRIKFIRIHDISNR